MSKKHKILLIILSALAFIYVLSGINKAHINPFISTINIDDMTAFSYTDNGSVLVSGQKEKLLFLNNNNELVKTVDMKASGSPFDKVERVTIYGNTVYVVGTCHYNRGIYLSGEGIVTYDLSGRFIDTIFHKDYPEDICITSNIVNNIIVNDKGIFVTLSDGHTVSAVDISTEDNKLLLSCKTDDNISDALYYVPNEELYLFSRSRNVYCISRSDNTLRKLENNNINTSLHTMLMNLPYGSSFPSINYVSGNAEFISSIKSDRMGAYYLRVSTGEINEINQINISFMTRLLEFVFYLAVLFLAAELLLLIIHSIQKKSLKSKQVIILFILAAVLVTSLIYCFNKYAQIRKDYELSIELMSADIRNDIEPYLLECEDKILSEGIEQYCTNKDNIAKLDLLQDELTQKCNYMGNKCAVYSKVFLLDEKQEIYCLLDSLGFNYYGQKFGYNFNEIKDSYETHLDKVNIAETSTSSNYMICRSIEDSNGKLLAIVMTGYYADNLAKTQSEYGVELFVNLSSILIVLYLLLSLTITFCDDFKRRSQRPKEEYSNRSADLAGIFVFLQAMIGNIDVVILVFVSQYLCRDMDPVAATAMAAIPLSACSAGQLIGTTFTTPIGRKLGDRTTSSICSIYSVLTLLLIVISIVGDQFILFVLGKFLFGIFIKGSLFVLGDTIPFGATSEEIKTAAVKSTKEATNSASILSILLAGYISQYLSYQMTYLLGAAVAIVLLALVPVFFQKKKKTDIKDEPTAETIQVNTPEEYNTGKKKKDALGWSMWLTPSMIIMALMFMLPRTVMVGYSSYLFPLYTASAGISTILISNLNVYAKTLGYLLSDQISDFSKNHSRTAVMSGSQLAIAASFILFIVCPNVYWAIAVLFIFTICDLMTQSVATLHVGTVAKNEGYNEKQEVSNYYTVNSVTFVVQSPILSAFLSLGYDFACAAVGAACGVMISIFTLFNRKKHN